MKDPEILLLMGEIGESLAALDRMLAVYRQYIDGFLDVDRRDLRDAVTLSEILCNSYTCLETLFFRISRVFENHLDASRWHKELLHKMRLEVPGVRKAVLSRDSYELLDELRRFRHFRRYYYDFEYDWEKLDFLRSIYERLIPLIQRELADYTVFLGKLAAGG